MRTQSVTRGLLALLLAVLGFTNSGIHAQLVATDVYEAGAEGEIWRFMGRIGASYKEACIVAGLDPDEFDDPVMSCYGNLNPEPDELWEPIGFDVLDDGTVENYRVYIADRFNSRVIVYDYFGNHLQTVDTFQGQNGPDALGGPESIVIDAAGNIIVSDTWNQRIIVFDSTFAYQFEVQMVPGVETGMLALAPNTTVAAPNGCASPGPVAIALTAWGYPNDPSLIDKNQILLYDDHFCRIGELGGANAAPNQPAGSFFLPGAATFGPSGEIYVAAYQEDKIEVFYPDASSPTGYVRGLGINVSGEPQTSVLDGSGQAVSLAGPYGVMVDQRGRLVVGDTGNNRIAVFLPPAHPDNTSGGAAWQFAFELVAAGNIAGSWLAVVRQDSWGRWLGSSVYYDSVFVFQVPELAVIEARAEEVVATINGDVLRVRGNIAVPFGKSTLTGIVPEVVVDPTVPATNRASLGAVTGPFVAAPGADIFDPLYADGQPIADIDQIDPGRFAQVYWDFPVQTGGDGQALFWISASADTPVGPVVADPKSVLAESVPGTCLAPILNPPSFSKPGFEVVDASTHILTTVYGHPLTVQLSATQDPDGVREIQYGYLEGPLNGSNAVQVGDTAALSLTDTSGGSQFWTIKYRAVATCGAPTAWTTIRFKTDPVAPRLTFGPIAPAASGIDPDNRPWHNAPEVTMLVVASDDDTFSSNVIFPDYPGVLNGQLTLSFTAEGPGQARFIRVQDPVANEFAEWSHKLRFVNIDRSAPQLTVTPMLAPNSAGWYRTDVPFRAVATDSPPLSGVRTLTSPEGLTIVGPSTRYLVTGEIVRGGEGVGLTVSATTDDYATNAQTVVSEEIRIDRTNPIASIGPDPNALYLDQVVVQLTADDLPGLPGSVASGLLRIRYMVNGGVPQDYAGPFALDTPGVTNVTFWAEDVADNASDAQTVAYTINGSPTASDGSFTTNEDVPVSVSVSASDPDNDALTFTVTTGPLHGSLLLDAATGQGTYTPEADYSGPDAFTVRVDGARGGSDSATVTITVTPVADAPRAVDDAYNATEDVPLVIAASGVLANDSDADGDSLTAALMAPPTNGAVVLNPDGSFSYTPATNFNGLDSFTYRANDGGVNSSPATVSITVAAVNDAPTAVDDAFATSEDTPLVAATPGVLGNDTDPDGDALTAVLVSGPSAGVLALNPDGSFSYTPNANFFGADAFTYRAVDGAANSQLARVAILVATVNDPPTAQNLQAATIETDPVTIVPAYADADVGDALTVSLFTPPVNGTALLSGGVFTYIAAAGFTGTDMFQYRVTDTANAAAVATVTVTVHPRNQSPTCGGAYATAGLIWPPNHRQAPFEIAGIVDPDGDAVAIAITRILQDEPTNTRGDGNTSIDAGGIGQASGWVRAERMGPQSDRTYNNGRLYEVSFTASDAKSGSCTGVIHIGVPHDRGQGASVIDNGCRWDSTTGGPALFCAPGAQPPVDDKKK